MVEDDDDNFGDFKFVMNSNQINGRISTTLDDDDDWGDFVDHSTQISVAPDVSNGLSCAQTPPDSMDAKNPSDKFSFQVASDESPKIQWVKPQGAIPLSIFGEEEEEDLKCGSVDSTVVFGENNCKQDSGSVKKGANCVGINDLMANMYTQNQENKVGTVLYSDMDFDPLNLNNSFNMKFNSSNSNVSHADSYTNGTSDPLNVKTNGVKSNGFGSDLMDVGERFEGNEEEVDDFDGWEFKAADTEVPLPTENQNSEVDRKTHGFNGVAQAFESGSNGYNHGDALAYSSGAFKKRNEWDFGFNLDASVVDEHGVILNLQNNGGQNDVDNGLNPSSISQDANADEDLWDFKDAFPDTASKDKLEELKPVITPLNGVATLALDGSQSFSMVDSLVASDGISQKSSERQDFGLNFKLNSVKEDQTFLDGNQYGDFHDASKGLNNSLVDENVDFDENNWEFKSALSDSGSNHKGEPGESMTGPEASASSFSSNQMNFETVFNHQKPIPLSIFGDEGLDFVDDHSMNHNAPTYMSVAHGHDSQNPGPTISINDLISSLYSQAEQNGSINRALEANENMINSSPRMSHSDLGIDDDCDSWEFKDASSDVKLPDQTYVNKLGDLHEQSSTKLQFDVYIDFYSKLNLSLNRVIHGLLDNLTKAENIASLSDEDAESKVLYDEIQNLSAELPQESLSSVNFSSEVLSGNKSVSELLELLRDPSLQIIDLEYQLSERLLLAKNDLRSAVELLKHAVSTLKILKLVPMEEQSNHVSIWYEMIAICVRELKHGSLIWKESVQKNVDGHILAEPQGKQYFCALGEIYRVIEVLRASVRLYKPCILLGYADPSGLFSLLNECSDIWSSSGLTQVLCKINDPIDCKALLDSINFIQNLDEHELQKHVLSGQQSTCCLSLLSAESIPGLELVVWNGKNYFLRIANLWANLISRDPPVIQHTN